MEAVLDEDSPFLELMPLAGWGMKGTVVGGGLVAGIGLVWWALCGDSLTSASGVECMVMANVPTIKGGTVTRVAVEKGKRLAEIIRENRLPVINFVQSVLC